MLSTAAVAEKPPKEIFRSDYQPLPYSADHVALRFELNDPEKTVVTSTVTYKRRGSEAADMVLNGVTQPAHMELIAVRLDGVTLEKSQYIVTDTSLTLPGALLPEAFTLEIVTSLDPAANSSLTGLYKTSGKFCTQQEPEGFRNMTYFYDRPDNMATYTTTIVADKAKYPYLLSNGNLVESGELDGGKHYTKWVDPWRKPCYLFALVAGDLACVSDEFVTRSGRKVLLRIFVEHGKEDQTAHAMVSLKKSFQWDEERFGLEYDLDQYNVVAVSDFNMGAMENKSLNVFNDRYVLANTRTATDGDLANVEGVIGHEYFHNWTGNRVTCRDWFQLTLKEGLTVYRDQEFSSDMNSRAVKRIGDVVRLRTAQFRQDSGPMAHPIRPESYISMENFYTVTVYEKGSEVIRMIATILGREGFRKGMDLYFARHDGTAVTCDDFVAAMEAANGVDLTQFRRWYSQSGTPVLEVTSEYDAAAQTLTLHIKQSCPPTPKQPTKDPFDIPFAVGLIGRSSRQSLPLQLAGEATAGDTTRVLRVREASQTFTFVHVPEAPVLSLLRGFSAPVKLTVPQQTVEDLGFLMAHDPDTFTRWEAGQQYAQGRLLGLIRGENTPYGSLGQAFRPTLLDPALDNAFKALAVSLPSESYLADLVPEGTADPDAIRAARDQVVGELRATLKDDLWATYRATRDPVANETDGQAAGRRSLKNLCLSYLMKGDKEDPEALQAARQQFASATTMTDQIGALSAVVGSKWATQCKDELLAAFYEQWKSESLVVLKWLGLQASRPEMDAAGLRRLMAHEAFDLKNPNKVYATVGGFTAVPTHFHRLNGSGYAVIAEVVQQLDKMNPAVAARMAGAFTGWKKYAPEARRELMRGRMQAILDSKPSPDTYEILSKSLL